MSEKSQTQSNNRNRSLASSNSMQSSFGFSVDCATSEDNINGLCVNDKLPEPPSIKRFLGKAGHNESFPSGISISGISNRFELDKGTKYKILPYHRGSLDARLYIGSTLNWTNYPQSQPKYIPNNGSFSPFISYFDPENVGYDHVVTKNPFVSTLLIHPLIIHNFKSDKTAFNFNLYEKNNSPATYHLDFCHDKSSQANYNPRTCKAYLNDNKLQSEILYGDCYDVTIFSYSSANENSIVKNEIRTNPVTIFISNAKQKGQVEDLAIYPRMDTVATLPSFEEMRNFANIGNPNIDNVSNLKIITDYCYSQSPRSAPLYCWFLFNQKRMTTINLNGAKKNYPAGPPMFEPSISGDGKLLIVNFGLGEGLHYSYNSSGTCNADGWKNFYPISNMPYDSYIYLNYPIGKAQRKSSKINNYTYTTTVPFLDTLGNPINKNDHVEGAYLWMDRKVRNIFFNAVNVVQDQFKGIQNSSCNDNDCMLDAAPGKGLHALGVWTKGRMIHLDSVVNMFDFGYRDLKHSPTDRRVFQMNLYQGEETTLRPSGMTVIGSQENLLNYYDSLSPLSPFDVVWNLNSNNERTGEIIFDDYLNKDLFLGTHFIQSTKPYTYNGGKITLFKNGFLPQKNYLSGDPLTKSQFEYKEIPLLQNISNNNPTSSNSTSSTFFEVLGGARVEPIAQGGVHGKGLYLDGINDSAVAQVKVTKPLLSYILTLWLDPRTLDEKERTIFTFPDYSTISLTKNSIIAKQCTKSSCVKKYFLLDNISLKTNKYFHLAVKITTINSANGANSSTIRRLSFYINGTSLQNTESLGNDYYIKSYLDFNVANNKTISSFDFYVNGQKGILSIGKNNLTQSDPAFHGWIDEFRAYQFDTTTTPKMYEEIICNLAYGSTVKIFQNDYQNKTLFPLYSLAQKMQLFYGNKSNSKKSNTTKMNANYFLQDPDFHKVNTQPTTALVCEQLRLTSYNSGSDFADQNISPGLICADKVHRNPHPDFGERCQRSTLYDIQSKPLKAGSPRPSFADVAFCLTCHENKNNILSLKTEALLKIRVNRELDHRRQPLNVPQTMTGCLPDDDLFYDLSIDRCTNQIHYLDYIFDYKKKIIP